jgi:hypothetical protein
MTIAGDILVLGAMLYGSTFNPGIPYFPNLVMPIVVGAIGLGMISVPLRLALIASVGVDRIGPASAIAVMLQSLGGPRVLAVIQGLLWLAGVVILLGGVALFIGYTAQQVAHAQEVKEAVDAQDG